MGNGCNSPEYRYFGWLVPCHEHLVNKKMKQRSYLTCFGSSNNVVVIAMVVRVSLNQVRFIDKG